LLFGWHWYNIFNLINNLYENCGKTDKIPSAPHFLIDIRDTLHSPTTVSLSVCQNKENIFLKQIYFPRLHSEYKIDMKYIDMKSIIYYIIYLLEMKCIIFIHNLIYNKFITNHNQLNNSFMLLILFKLIFKCARKYINFLSHHHKEQLILDLFYFVLLFNL